MIHINYLDIPMPNEFEPKERLPLNVRITESLSSIFNYLKVHITVEEILLVAIILLLLLESANEEVLIVLLIYILLF